MRHTTHRNNRALVIVIGTRSCTDKRSTLKQRQTHMHTAGDGAYGLPAWKQAAAIWEWEGWLVQTLLPPPPPFKFDLMSAVRVEAAAKVLPTVSSMTCTAIADNRYQNLIRVQHPADWD